MMWPYQTHLHDGFLPQDGTVALHEASRNGHTDAVHVFSAASSCQAYQLTDPLFRIRSCMSGQLRRHRTDTALAPGTGASAY